jgi:hypothetical protein
MAAVKRPSLDRRPQWREGVTHIPKNYSVGMCPVALCIILRCCQSRSYSTGVSYVGMPRFFRVTAVVRRW